MKKRKKNKLKRLGSSPVFMILLILIFALSLALIIRNTQNPENKYNLSSLTGLVSSLGELDEPAKIVKFSSADEFKEYLEKAGESAPFGFGINRGFAVEPMLDQDVMLSEAVGRGGGGETADRVSATNVQVVGIDEPDLVKTDGQEIYFSNELFYGPVFRSGPGLINAEIGMPARYSDLETNLIDAWPVDDLKIDSSIEASGNLLLSDNTLVVFDNRTNKVYGYDVSDKINPSKKWTIRLEDNTYILTSRLYNNEIYIVTSTRVNPITPCPIRPLFVDDRALDIACSDIYHPVPYIPSDSTLTAMKIDINSGEVKDTVSFLSASYSSIIYMSPESLYVTYNHSINMLDFMLDFIQSEATDLFPVELTIKLSKINNYDISPQSKMTEYSILMDQYMNSLDKDERLRINNEMENRMIEYYKKHMRNIVKTEIVKIDLDSLDVKANGNVPGTPLNQFSLDEYQGHLRIATTISGNFLVNTESANDVYVLDKNLKIKGSVLNLGLEERIYSVRFIADKGYLVTFRQIDPFYVLDLSNPSRPQMKGELKIPGYSSYLHPIKENKILGIGKEGSQLKLSYFDVSNPADPKEIDKYTLDEYHSESLYDHHAFLQDDKHQVFFLPGTKGAYIFSYANDKLELAKAISQTNTKRAVYLNDYMYIIGQNDIIVLDESNWERVNELDLNE